MALLLQVMSDTNTLNKHVNRIGELEVTVAAVSGVYSTHRVIDQSNVYIGQDINLDLND